MRVGLALIISLLVAPAVAQDWPDLRGTWKGTSRAVVAGDGGHYGTNPSQPPAFREVELTIEWTEQDEGRYIGTISSGEHAEPKLGVASADGQRLYTVDADGLSDGRLIDENHFELCYMQSSATHPQMVASCVIFERMP